MKVSTTLGEFSFTSVLPGRCHLLATFPGYEDFVTDNLLVASGQEVRFEIALQITRVSESVVVHESLTREQANNPTETAKFNPAQLDALPLPTDRFQEALPLVPGVVRDPEGKLSFNGARPSQSTLLVNGANVTDQFGAIRSRQKVFWQFWESGSNFWPCAWLGQCSENSEKP